MDAVVQEYSMRAGAPRIHKALPPDPDQTRQSQVRDIIDKGSLYPNNMVKQTNQAIGLLVDVKEKARDAVFSEARPSPDDKGAMYEMEYWNVLLTNNFAKILAPWYLDTETTTKGLEVFDIRK